MLAAARCAAALPTVAAARAKGEAVQARMLCVVVGGCTAEHAAAPHAREGAVMLRGEGGGLVGG